MLVSLLLGERSKVLELVVEGQLAEITRVGAQIDGYRVGEPLGEGGMGTVYRAVDVETGVAEALKTVRTVSRAMVSGLRQDYTR